MAFVAVPYFIYASNESKSVLARDLGDCRDNLRNSRSVFLIVDGKIMKNWEDTSDYGKHMENISHQDLVSNQRNVYNVIYETNYRTWRKSYMDLTKLTAYEIIEHRPLPDLKSEGALLRHKKSGARVLLISNDDENKYLISDSAHRPRTVPECHISWNILFCVARKSFRPRIRLWNW